jgi:tetratricopeptide (TPR) repeat protein
MRHSKVFVGFVAAMALLASASWSQEAAEDPEAIRHLMDGIQRLEGEDFVACAGSYRLALAAADLPETRFQARLGLSTCLGGMGRTLEASQVAQEAAAEAPDHAVAQHVAGAALLDIGQSGDAIPLLERATTLAPAFMVAWKDLGRARAATGDDTGAEVAFGRALALNDEDADAWLGLAVARYQQERYEEALAAFNQAVAVNPNLPRARYGRGACRLMVGDEDGARREAEALASMAPGLAERLIDEIEAETEEMTEPAGEDG